MRLLLVLLATLLPIKWAGAAPDTLAQIRARGTLIIGTDATYPPFELKTGDRFEGFDIELGNELGRELGVRVQWQNIAWSGIFAGLQTSKFDLVMSDVVINDRRKREMAFSRPYFLAGEIVARRRGDTRIGSSGDLRGKRVAVQTETTGQYAIEKLGPPVVIIRKFETMQAALLDVRNGNSDAAVGDRPALREMLRKGYPELETVGGVFVAENYGVVARKGPENVSLLREVNAALGRIFADGRYMSIYQRTLHEPMPPTYLVGLDRVRSQGTTLAAEQEAHGSALALRPEVLREAWPLLLKGAILTLWVTVLSLLLGIPMGLGLALVRRVAKPLRWLADAYIEVVRGTPLLMQIFVIYFVLPALGIMIRQEVAAVLALAINASAYTAEIFRAGIDSLDPGQMEAARSLGMSNAGAMRWVILPQTVRRTLPPLTNEAVAKLKDSSLVSIIGLSDLTRVGQEQSSNSGAPVTVVLAVALIYLLMTLPLTLLARRLEARWARANAAGTSTPSQRRARSLLARARTSEH